jgi:diaminohydroxyphosphoribosylaminopyrimidine deaminase/5-amino-6-(5-phosphoribosylamino)uracil reductase
MQVQGVFMRACAAARVPITCISEEDPQHLLRAAELAGASAGKSAPHPNVGCVIAQGIQVVGEGFLYGQGTRSAEIQAVSRAGEFSKGATAYLNLEPEVYHSQAYGSAVHALKEVTYF